ncbi:MAG: flippase-like domain-containing protein [Acidobacteria bacterium]|nr:flippase-like domain-containing protein [Acidobacteriota bacterium]
MKGRTGWLIAQVVVTAVLLVLLGRNLDMAAFVTLFAKAPLAFYVTALAVMLAGQVAYAWRWRLLLTASGVALPLSSVVRQYFVGIFVNNFLPSTVGGDVAKVYYLGQDHGRQRIAASVVIDRLLGVGWLALLAVIALAASPVTAPRLVAAQMACAGIAVAVVIILVTTGVGTGGLAKRISWMGTGAVKLAERLQRLRLDMAMPLRHPEIVVKAALVVAGYIAAVTGVYMRFASLQGVPIQSAIAVFAVVSATAVLSNLPISLNGLGLREQLHVALLAPIGISPELAVAMSLLTYAHLIIASLIGLVFWLRQPRASRVVPTSA